MNKEQLELCREQIADFRYRIIADLLHTHLKRGQINEIITKKTKMNYSIPYSRRTTVSAACLRKWLSLYRKYGKQALMPKLRKDLGVSKSLPPHEAALILSTLEKRPHLTATAVLKLLQHEGKVTHRLSKSSLSRLVRSSGLSRSERLKLRDDEQNLKFNFLYPLECVQADDLHAFPVPNAKGNKRKAILMAFLDDATRRILYADFSFTERSLSFEQGIKHILKSHGRINQLYVDNGSPFVSTQTKRILDTLNLRISHSRPGIPKGRGKIERFFRTLRDQFLRPLDESSVKSIDDLNIRLHTCLESEYHRNPHRGIENKTPLEAWLENTKYITHLDSSVDLDRVFYHIQYRKVYRDSTFTLNGILYEAPSILAGCKIKLYYDPLPARRRVFVEHDGKDYGEVRPVNSFANAHVIRNKHNNTLDIKPHITESNTNLLDPLNNVRLSIRAATLKEQNEE